jgi:low temperature requirement protein LtrA
MGEGRRTSPVELLWDLVFVFAVTQVTALLASDLSWAGFGRSMLVLALVWWAWSASYSYHHLLLIAGIIVFAVGVRFAINDVGEPLGEGARLALCGGVATYLVGHAAFRLRIAEAVSYDKLAAAGAALVVFALGGDLSAWVVAAAVAALLALLCGREALLDRRLREATASA